MVISMEPMLTIPDCQHGTGRCRERDILPKTADGNENTTHHPVGPVFNRVGCGGRIRRACEVADRRSAAPDPEISEQE